MKSFEMCRHCRQEYEDPADRRFHAQPVCCPSCGPRVTVVDKRGHELADAAGTPLRAAARRLMAGDVVALKGVGGFHLAVRAEDAGAVRRLRSRKQRDAKPLALMVRDVAVARSLVRLSAAGEVALKSPIAPIVLAPRWPGTRIAAEVATGTHRLGVMLPYTPMHHALFDAVPALGPVVMTSGNRSDEPLVTDNAEALRRLGDVADAFVMHDRGIARGVDDSVLLDIPVGSPVPVRRSRGMVPGTIPLPDGIDDGTPGLCVGGELKTTVAVVRAGAAVLSQHLGDLKHPSAYGHFQQAIDDLLRLFEVVPAWVACDRHPAYLSRKFAVRWAQQHRVRLVEVQHHHAHAASLMAEHGLRGPMLALVADGVGFGDGGAIWGGELLLAELRSYRRLARIRPLRLPGGDASSYDTRRCALALLHQAFGDAGLDHPLVDRLGFDPTQRRGLVSMLRRNVCCVETSALGRVFDGVAALLGLRHTNRFEAEAPIAIEAAAFTCDPEPLEGDGGFTVVEGDPWTFDLSPTVRRVVEGRARGEPASVLADEFQRGVSNALAAMAERANVVTGLRTVGLTGGVFNNEALTCQVSRRLVRAGLDVRRHELVPPNDGGLSLGQAAVAHARSREWSKEG